MPQIRRGRLVPQTRKTRLSGAPNIESQCVCIHSRLNWQIQLWLMILSPHPPKPAYHCEPL